MSGLMLNVGADTSAAFQSLGRLDSQLDALVRSSQQTNASLSMANRIDFSGVTRNIGNLTTGLSSMALNAARFTANMAAPVQAVSRLTSEIARATTGLTGLYDRTAALQALVRSGDGLTELVNMADRTGNASITLARLNSMATETRSSQEAIARLYGSIKRSQPDLDKSSAELVTKTFMKGSMLSGATREGASAAVLQFTQALSAGVLRGEEYNSMLEQTPVLVEGIAKALGKTMGQMREMANDGKLTAEVVIGAFKTMSTTIDKDFNSVHISVNTAATSLRESLSFAFGSIARDTGILDATAAAIGRLNSKVQSFSAIRPLGVTAAHSYANVLKAALQEKRDSVNNLAGIVKHADTKSEAQLDGLRGAVRRASLADSKAPPAFDLKPYIAPVASTLGNEGLLAVIPAGLGDILRGVASQLREIDVSAKKLESTRLMNEQTLASLGRAGPILGAFKSALDTLNPAAAELRVQLGALSASLSSTLAPAGGLLELADVAIRGIGSYLTAVTRLASGVIGLVSTHLPTAVRILADNAVRLDTVARALATSAFASLESAVGTLERIRQPLAGFTNLFTEVLRSSMPVIATQAAPIGTAISHSIGRIVISIDRSVSSAKRAVTRLYNSFVPDSDANDAVFYGIFKARSFESLASRLEAGLATVKESLFLDIDHAIAGFSFSVSSHYQDALLRLGLLDFSAAPIIRLPPSHLRNTVGAAISAAFDVLFLDSIRRAINTLSHAVEMYSARVVDVLSHFLSFDKGFNVGHRARQLIIGLFSFDTSRMADGLVKQIADVGMELARAMGRVALLLKSYTLGMLAGLSGVRVTRRITVADDVQFSNRSAVGRLLRNTGLTVPFLHKPGVKHQAVTPEGDPLTEANAFRATAIATVDSMLDVMAFAYERAKRLLVPAVSLVWSRIKLRFGVDADFGTLKDSINGVIDRLLERLTPALKFSTDAVVTLNWDDGEALGRDFANTLTNVMAALAAFGDGIQGMDLVTPIVDLLRTTFTHVSAELGGFTYGLLDELRERLVAQLVAIDWSTIRDAVTDSILSLDWGTLRDALVGRLLAIDWDMLGDAVKERFDEIDWSGLTAVSAAVDIDALKALPDEIAKVASNIEFDIGGTDKLLAGLHDLYAGVKAVSGAIVAHIRATVAVISSEMSHALTTLTQSFDRLVGRVSSGAAHTAHGVANELTAAIGAIVDAAKRLGDVSLEKFNGAITAIRAAVGSVVEALSHISATGLEKLGDTLRAGADKANAGIDRLITSLAELKARLAAIELGGVVEFAVELKDDAADYIKSRLSGISSAVSGLYADLAASAPTLNLEPLADAFSAVVSRIKNAIESVSQAWSKFKLPTVTLPTANVEVILSAIGDGYDRLAARMARISAAVKDLLDFDKIDMDTGKVLVDNLIAGVRSGMTRFSEVVSELFAKMDTPMLRSAAQFATVMATGVALSSVITRLIFASGIATRAMGLIGVRTVASSAASVSAQMSALQNRVANIGAASATSKLKLLSFVAAISALRISLVQLALVGAAAGAASLGFKLPENLLEVYYQKLDVIKGALKSRLAAVEIVAADNLPQALQWLDQRALTVSVVADNGAKTLLAGLQHGLRTALSVGPEVMPTFTKLARGLLDTSIYVLLARNAGWQGMAMFANKANTLLARDKVATDNYGNPVIAGLIREAGMFITRMAADQLRGLMIGLREGIALLPTVASVSIKMFNGVMKSFAITFADLVPGWVGDALVQFGGLIVKVMDILSGFVPFVGPLMSLLKDPLVQAMMVPAALYAISSPARMDRVGGWLFGREVPVSKEKLTEHKPGFFDYARSAIWNTSGEYTRPSNRNALHSGRATAVGLGLAGASLFYGAAPWVALASGALLGGGLLSGANGKRGALPALAVGAGALGLVASTSMSSSVMLAAGLTTAVFGVLGREAGSAFLARVRTGLMDVVADVVSVASRSAGNMVRNWLGSGDEKTYAQRSAPNTLQGVQEALYRIRQHNSRVISGEMSLEDAVFSSTEPIDAKTYSRRLTEHNRSRQAMGLSPEAAISRYERAPLGGRADDWARRIFATRDLGNESYIAQKVAQAAHDNPALAPGHAVLDAEAAVKAVGDGMDPSTRMARVAAKKNLRSLQSTTDTYLVDLARKVRERLAIATNAMNPDARQDTSWVPTALESTKISHKEAMAEFANNRDLASRLAPMQPMIAARDAYNDALVKNAKERSAASFRAQLTAADTLSKTHDAYTGATGRPFDASYLEYLTALKRNSDETLTKAPLSARLADRYDQFKFAEIPAVASVRKALDAQRRIAKNDERVIGLGKWRRDNADLVSVALAKVAADKSGSRDDLNSYGQNRADYISKHGELPADFNAQRIVRMSQLEKAARLKMRNEVPTSIWSSLARSAVGGNWRDDYVPKAGTKINTKQGGFIRISGLAKASEKVVRDAPDMSRRSFLRAALETRGEDLLKATAAKMVDSSDHPTASLLKAVNLEKRAKLQLTANVLTAAEQIHGAAKSMVASDLKPVLSDVKLQRRGFLVGLAVYGSNLKSAGKSWLKLDEALSRLDGDVLSKAVGIQKNVESVIAPVVDNSARYKRVFGSSRRYTSQMFGREDFSPIAPTTLHNLRLAVRLLTPGLHDKLKLGNLFVDTNSSIGAAAARARAAVDAYDNPVKPTVKTLDWYDRLGAWLSKRMEPPSRMARQRGFINFGVLAKASEVARRTADTSYRIQDGSDNLRLPTPAAPKLSLPPPVAGAATTSTKSATDTTRYAPSFGRRLETAFFGALLETTAATLKVTAVGASMAMSPIITSAVLAAPSYMRRTFDKYGIGESTKDASLKQRAVMGVAAVMEDLGKKFDKLAKAVEPAINAITAFTAKMQTAWATAFGGPSVVKQSRAENLARASEAAKQNAAAAEQTWLTAKNQYNGYNSRIGVKPDANKLAALKSAMDDAAALKDAAGARAARTEALAARAAAATSRFSGILGGMAKAASAIGGILSTISMALLGISAKFLAIAAAVVAVGAAIYAAFLGPSDSIKDNLGWMFDKVTGMLGFAPVTRGGTLQDVLDVAPQQTVGNIDLKLSREVSAIDTKAMSKGQKEALKSVLTSTNAELAELDAAYYKQGEKFTKEQRARIDAINEERRVALLQVPHDKNFDELNSQRSAMSDSNAKLREGPVDRFGNALKVSKIHTLQEYRDERDSNPADYAPGLMRKFFTKLDFELRVKIDKVFGKDYLTEDLKAPRILPSFLLEGGESKLTPRDIMHEYMKDIPTNFIAGTFGEKSNWSNLGDNPINKFIMTEGLMKMDWSMFTPKLTNAQKDLVDPLFSGMTRDEQDMMELRRKASEASENLRVNYPTFGQAHERDKTVAKLDVMPEKGSVGAMTTHAAAWLAQAQYGLRKVVSDAGAPTERLQDMLTPEMRELQGGAFDEYNKAKQDYVSLYAKGARRTERDAAIYEHELKIAANKMREAGTRYETINTSLAMWADETYKVRKVGKTLETLNTRMGAAFKLDFGKAGQDFAGDSRDVEDFNKLADYKDGLANRRDTTVEQHRDTVRMMSASQRMAKSLEDRVNARLHGDTYTDWAAKVGGIDADGLSRLMNTSAYHTSRQRADTPLEDMNISSLLETKDKLQQELNTLASDAAPEIRATLVEKLADVTVRIKAQIPTQAWSEDLNNAFRALNLNDLQVPPAIFLREAAAVRLAGQTDRVRDAQNAYNSAVASGLPTFAKKVDMLRELMGLTENLRMVTAQENAAAARDLMANPKLSAGQKAVYMGQLSGTMPADAVLGSPSAANSFTRATLRALEGNATFAQGVAEGDDKLIAKGARAKHLAAYQQGKITSLASEVMEVNFSGIASALSEAGAALDGNGFKDLPAGVRRLVSQSAWSIAKLNKQLERTQVSGDSGGIVAVLKAKEAEQDRIFAAVQPFLMTTGKALSGALNSAGASGEGRLASASQLSNAVKWATELQMLEHGLTKTMSPAEAAANLQRQAVIKRQQAYQTEDLTQGFDKSLQQVNSVFGVSLNDVDFIGIGAKLRDSMSAVAKQIQRDLTEAYTRGTPEAIERLVKKAKVLADLGKTITFNAELRRSYEDVKSEGTSAAFNRIKEALPDTTLELNDFRNADPATRRKLAAEANARVQLDKAMDLPNITEGLAEILNNTSLSAEARLAAFSSKFETDIGKSWEEFNKTPLERNNSLLEANIRALTDNTAAITGVPVAADTPKSAIGEISSGTFRSKLLDDNAWGLAATEQLTSGLRLDQRLAKLVKGVNIDATSVAMADTAQAGKLTSLATRIGVLNRAQSTPGAEFTSEMAMERETAVMELSQLQQTIKERAMMVVNEGLHFAESVTSGFSSVFTDHLKGKFAAGKNGLQSLVSGILDQFTSGVIDTFTKGLLDPFLGKDSPLFSSLRELGGGLVKGGLSLGKEATGGGKGLWDTITGSLGSLFGNTAKDTVGPSMIVSAISASTGAIVAAISSSAISGGLSAGGGLTAVSSMFKVGNSGGLADIFAGDFLGLPGFATGGPITGQGTGTSDSIPALLSNGEFVVNAAATSRNRTLLHAINDGTIARFATGGLVGMDAVPEIKGPSMVAPERSKGDAAKEQQVINIHITGDISRQTRTEIMKMLPQIAAGVNQTNRERGVR